MKKFLVSLALVGLTACASIGGSGAPGMSPQQGVFAAKQSYAVALTAAVAYKRLPPCPTPSKVCSDPKVVSQLQKVDEASAALLDGAEATVRSGGGNAAMAVKAATEAVSAFTTITQSLSVK